MSNGIAQRQLESQNIARLAAQRYVYSKAKRLMAIQLLLGVPIIILISLIALCLKLQSFMNIFGKSAIDISWSVAISGVFITLFDMIYLEQLIDKMKEKAAKIQEVFDCDVLDLPWNNITVGRRPDLEDIIENTNNYSETRKDPGFRSLLNWYPKDVDRLPLGIARIICQRSNMRWDVELRQNISYYLGAIAVIMFIILLLFGILGELSVKTFIEKVITPCIPIWVFSIRQIQQNKKAIVSLGELKQKADKAWENAMNSLGSPSKLDIIARQLQDSLFLNRKMNPLIFDFIYKVYRPSQEGSMNYSCKEMIEEYEKRGGTKKSLRIVL